jgi:hypothetical protein
MYLHPRRFRGDRPGWFVCNLSCKEVPKHRINNCVRGGCPDYRERDDEIVAGNKGKRINWDGAASETIPDAPQIATLRDWAAQQIESGESMAEIAKRIGCTWGTLQNAVKQPVKQSAAEPEEVGTCWDCGRTFPADEMHPDGDTLECDDCYREAHEPPPMPQMARCPRCECEVDGLLTIAGFGTVCEPCAEVIRQEWEAEQYPAPEPEPEPEQNHAQIAQLLTDTTDETRKAAQAYLRHIGLGDQEVFALGVWLDAWAARGTH